MKAWTTRARVTLLCAALAVVGCAGLAAPPVQVAAPGEARTEESHILYASTTWRGDVRLVKPLIVTRSATLTLQPGTRVFFDLPAPAPGSDREPWILVLGSLVALGEPERPIIFTSVRLAQNELDDMVHVREAKEAHFRHCRFERGPWALHVHDTVVDVLSCEFQDNFGGVRFQGGRVTVRGSRFVDNRIGLRCLKASPTIEENVFQGNLTGIFFREGVQGAVVRNNNFDDSEYDIKLGEAQTHDVAAAGNWWKAREEGRLDDRIFDALDAPGLGTVAVEPALAAPWGAQAGKP